MTATVDQKAADTIRVLSVDAIQKANSGHPGMPMGMADIAVVLWSKYLKIDPTDPTWPDRDRFVLSNGRWRTSSNSANGAQKPQGIQSTRQSSESK